MVGAMTDGAGAGPDPETPLETIRALRVLPVVVLDDAAAARPLSAALVEGGLPAAEVTFRTAAAERGLATMAADRRLLVGAGTVVTAEQVDRAVAAGARFVVSPGFSRSVVERALELGVAIVPGVATASEIIAALDVGLTMLKFFPAQASGGVATVRALAAPFPQVRFVPTGGITATCLPDYLAVPAVAAVGGSWMVSRDLIAGGRFDEVARRSADAVAVATASARQH
jgi:2-dehydro-3-deoxyphosphogluconate aldolase/(4S)-4-hydroxy-2-oxoglutarate aldolase